MDEEKCFDFRVAEKLDSRVCRAKDKLLEWMFRDVLIKLLRSKRVLKSPAKFAKNCCVENPM